MLPIAIYIHIPYCLYKCHYCDFNSYPVTSAEPYESEYLKGLLKEIASAKTTFSKFETPSIFFGGGTPSLFSPQAIEKLIEKVSDISDLSSDCEITLEVNPKTVTKQNLKDFLKAGINRFSVGVQSFQNRYLSPLGRLHTGDEAEETLKIFHQIGADNFNIDLMFGFPDQATEEVLEDIKKAVELHPAHLSYYNLTLEKGTLLNEQERKGDIRLPENEIQAEMYQRGMEFLEKKAYSLYEISNFSLPNKKSRHNLAYWKYQDYLGFGAGAVSFLNRRWFSAADTKLYGWRWTNPLTPKDYLASVEKKDSGLLKEKIDLKTAQGEFWMMGLRLKEGVAISEYYSHFGEENFRIYREIMNSFITKGWVQLDQDHFAVTEEGRFFTNDIVSSLLI